MFDQHTTSTLVSAGNTRRLSTLTRRSFQRGWDDGCRFLLGLAPADFGRGEPRDRNYVDGWKTRFALQVALRGTP